MSPFPAPEPHPAQPHGATPHSASSDCSEVLLRVFEYIDQEMTQDDCVRIKAHLDGCGDCMSIYERDLLLKALIRRSCGCETAPDTLRMSIMTRITMIHVEYDELG